jgi:hypothetical protein
MGDIKTSPRLLTDVRFVQLSLDEATNDGKIRVKGEFAKCDIATENKRIYPESVWNKEIGRLGRALGERRVFGEMDHPSDGRTSLNRVSHIVTGLKVSKDGKVVGEAEILPTESGKNLSALLSSGCKVGVSSRGYGSTKSNDKGEEVVQTDYKLVTFDFVAEPADSDAYPDVHTESTNVIFEGVDMNAEQEKAAEFARKIEAEKTGTKNSDVREEFAQSILATISKMKGEATEEARTKLLGDPKTGAALAFVEGLKEQLKPFWTTEDDKSVVALKDAEIAKLKTEKSDLDLKLKTALDERDRAIAVAKEAGYKYWLEHTLASDPDAELVKKAVGDVKAFENLDALKGKVEGFRKELSKKREEAKKVEDARKAEIAEATKLVEDARAAAEQKAAQLEESLAKTLRSEKALALKLYVEQRLLNHPKAAKIRPLLETVKFESKDQVNALIDDFREKESDTDELESIRARVRAKVGGGDEDRDEDVIVEEQRPKSKDRSGDQANFNGLGIGLGELKKLSGVPRK